MSMLRFTVQSVVFSVALLLFPQISFSATNWKMIDKLVQEQKYSAAITQLDTILKQISKQSSKGQVVDNKDWQQSLIIGAVLRSQQGQFEEAIQYLTSQSWPQDNESILLLNLHLAKLLHAYIQHYRWEIQQREKVASNKSLTLKLKTMDQLITDVNIAYYKAYQLAQSSIFQQQDLNQFALPVLPTLKNFFDKPDYPDQVRGGVMDTVTYLWVDLLADSSLWSPSQSNQTDKLSVQDLLSPSFSVDITDARLHPLQRIVSLLNGLHKFETIQAKPEAALETFREKIQKIADNKTGQIDRKQLIKALQSAITGADSSLTWVNVLRNTLATMMVQSEDDDAKIKAVAVLNECLQDMSQSISKNTKEQKVTEFCKSQLAKLTHPELRLSAMKSDGLNKRSLLLEHANLNRIYFRAWRMNLQQVIKGGQYQQIQQFLKTGKTPDRQWQTDVVRGKDYNSHKTFIAPPLNEYGYWLIAASYKPDFSISDNKNVLQTTHLNLTRLVADIDTNRNQLNVTVYNGETGEVAPRVKLQLWLDNNTGQTQPIASVLSANDGRADFPIVPSKSYQVVAQLGHDFTVVDNIYAGYNPDTSQRVKSGLMFTDRAIYRPGQTIQWKVVAYQGDANTGKYQVIPDSEGVVKLQDANGKQVQEIKVKTNQYGSASGEFTAKTGLMLGHWNITSSWGTNKSIRVEEYKRPTFDAKIQPGIDSLRLNAPGRVKGIVNYYFGQSVTDATVKWRVERLPLYPWRFAHRGGYGGGVIDGLMIASGNAQLDKKGEFHIPFVPKAALLLPGESQEQESRVYEFKVSADITNSGGETKNVSRIFKVGKLGIAADIQMDQGYGTPEKPLSVDITRQDLDGTPRSGSAFWTLNRVAQPDLPKMPSEFTIAENDKPRSTYATEDDAKRPRWDTSVGAKAMIDQWEDAEVVAQGALKHNQEGHAQLVLSNIRPGLYRLNYTSKDRAGQVYRSQEPVYIGAASSVPIKLPALLKAQNTSVEVGAKVKLLAGSGFTKAPALLEIYHGNQLLKRSLQRDGIKQIEFAVTRQYRGGLTFVLTLLRDYQLIRLQQDITVAWTDRHLNLAFSTFRDKLQPGQKETWRVTVKDAKNQTMEKGAIELLASMYDRSLDFFAKHDFPDVQSLYPLKSLYLQRNNNLGSANNLFSTDFYAGSVEQFSPAGLKLFSWIRPKYPLGGQPRMMASPAPMYAPAPAPVSAIKEKSSVDVNALQGKVSSSGTPPKEPPLEDSQEFESFQMRTNFSETAFFLPHLVLEANGSVAFEFEVPESLTQWKVWASAISKDLRGGSVTEYARTSKELMVRPYLPRFLRAGDHAQIDVLVNNTSDKVLQGKLDFDVIDPETQESLASRFKLVNKGRDFKVDAGQSSRLRFSLIAPNDLGIVAIRARASASNGQEKYGDGEQRPLPVLPSRIHLSQSRFTALKGETTKNLEFKQLSDTSDTSRINDKLVVSIDGQLFYSMLNALPYLVDYPYECTEQTLNRFLSTSIVDKVFADHPAIRAVASKMAQRNTQFEQWDAVNNDANRKMLLEETPWLVQAQGGNKAADELIRILDPRVASNQHQNALHKLRKAQTASGGFPWWEGGRDSPYITTYLLHGFSRALEFKVDIPKDMVQKAWGYLYKHYDQDLQKRVKDSVIEITFINYLLSSYPDASWTGGVFSENDKQQMLDLSFQKWQELPTLLKAYLSLTLKRSGREQQAKLVFDSIMDGAKTDDELGTYWAPEDRSWLWYNDTVDTHAFILRALMELNPDDPRRHGLVQWLMLNKKLNHWKSTRATAESIFSLVHYLQREGQMASKEQATIKIGNKLQKTLVFKPYELPGVNNQLLVEGGSIKPDMAQISVENQGKSLMFASATWHFSTENLPQNAEGDFFEIERSFFKRIQNGKHWELQPLAEGAAIMVGDELEVKLSLRTKHSAEYVHLRAPRGAGFEPVSHTSGYRWDDRLSYYEEIRDSGANYFFEQLPTGEYAFKYRLRAATAGKFRVSPASVQSIYAPEFNAYSKGQNLNIE